MLHNISWSVLANVYRAILQIVLNLALAWFLAPLDYGLVALVLPVTVFVLLIGEFGLSAAIIRTKELSQFQLDAAASFCLACGAAIFLIVLLFYVAGGLVPLRHPLADLSLGFASVVMIAMSGIVPKAILERNLEYGKLALIETLAATTSCAIAIVAASFGAGVWTFLIYHLVLQMLRAAGFWKETEHKLKLTRRWSGVRDLLRFGGWVLAFNVVNYSARNFDNYIVASILGTTALGIYALAYQIMLIPLMTITWPVSGVLMSVLSKVKTESSRVADIFLGVVTLVSLITLPAMSCVVVEGQLAIQFFLPQHWQAVSLPVSHLAVAGALQSLTSLVGVLFVIKGRVRQQFQLGMILTAITLVTVTIVASMQGTIVGVVNAYVALTLVFTVLYAGIAVRLLHTSYEKLLQAVMPAGLAVIISLFMSFALLSFVPSARNTGAELVISAFAFGFGLATIIFIYQGNLRTTLNQLRATSVELSGQNKLETVST